LFSVNKISLIPLKFEFRISISPRQARNQLPLPPPSNVYEDCFEDGSLIAAQGPWCGLAALQVLGEALRMTQSERMKSGRARRQALCYSPGAPARSFGSLWSGGNPHWKAEKRFGQADRRTKKAERELKKQRKGLTAAS